MRRTLEPTGSPWGFDDDPSGDIHRLAIRNGMSGTGRPANGERSVAEQLIEAAEHGFKTLRVKNPQVAAEAIHGDRFHLTEQDMPAPALEGAGHPERRQVVAGHERRHGDLAHERVRLIR